MAGFTDYKQRLNRLTDTEFEQTLIRLLLALVVVIYINAVYLTRGELGGAVYWLAHAYFVVSVSLVASTVFIPRPSHLRRIAGTLMDIATVSGGMALSSYYTSLFWGGYLWISMGNGLRFGNRYLLFSVVFSAIAYSIVLHTSEYWQQNLPLGYGLLFWLLLSPVYISVMIKRLASALEHAQEASRTKSRFLANMSHELRTPLNAIIGYSEMVAEDLDEVGEKRHGEDLAKITASARHLLELINELLDISKIEAGKMDVCYEQVDMPPLIREVTDGIDPLMQKNGNQLSVVISDELGQVWIDVLKFKQVLFNLLSNASKFTEHGDVSLFATAVTRGDGRWMKLVVKDTGIGMTQAQLGKLFQPFVQADESTSRKYGGTGLGLTLCRQFAQMLGGEIDVYSEQGKGSTFIVILPLWDTSPAALTPQQ